MYGMDTSSMSLLGFGAVAVIGAVVICLVSFFSMKETSFDDVIQEQRKKKEKEDRERSLHNKQKRDQYKKKFEHKKKKVGNGKVEKIDSSVSPMHEVQIKETSEVATNAPAPVAPKKPKGKATKRPEVESKEDSPKPTHTIMKQIPDKPKPEPVVQAKHTQSVPKALPAELKSESEAPKKKERNRSVSFSDEVSDKAKVESEQEKSKKKKKKTETEAENVVVTQLRDASLHERDVQNVLTIIRQKYGIDVGGGSKIKDLQHQLDLTKKKLRQSESGQQQYVTRCMAAESAIEQHKQDLMLEKTKFTSLEKAMQDQEKKTRQEMSMIQSHHVAEIKQLKDKLALSGDYEELRKAFEGIKTENAILRTEVQKNASVVAEKNRLSGDLKQSQLAHQEAQRRCDEMESKISEYRLHSENVTKQQVEKEQSYLHQLNEQSLGLQKTQQSYAALENEYQKVKGELQTTQGHSASLLNQVTLLTEENESKGAAQSAVDQRLAEREKLLEERDAVIQGLNNQNAELATNAKNLEQQISQLTSQIDSLSQEVKDKDAATKSSQDRDEEMGKLKGDLDAANAEAQTFKKEAEKLKKKNNDLRERSWKAMDALSTLEKSIPGKVSLAKEEADARCDELERNTRRILSDAFPEVSSCEKEFQEWVTAFVANASTQYSQVTQSSEPPPELEEARREAEELRSQLEARSSAADELRQRVEQLEDSMRNASEKEREFELSVQKSTEELERITTECNKYKSILSSTEEILSKLQSSVEAEEGVWKKKVEDAYTEASKAHQDAEDLKKTIQELRADNSSLRDTANQCENLRQKLEEVTSKVSELQDKLAAKEEAITQNGDSQEDLNKTAIPNGNEDEVAKLKERLEKEKTLTKNLGQAATKLQSVLKQTQEQLSAEREKSSDLESKLEDKSPN